jgi:hypothetical protein
MCDQQDPRYATQGAWPHQLSGPRRSDRDWIRCEARTPDCDWACATASKVRAVRLRSLRELRRDILRWLVTRSMSHPTRLRRFGQPSRSSPKGRAKDGWEAGRRAARLASSGHDSPALANSFQLCELAGKAFGFHMPPIAGIARVCQHNDTRNGTRRKSLGSAEVLRWSAGPTGDDSTRTCRVTVCFGLVAVSNVRGIRAAAE